MCYLHLTPGCIFITFLKRKLISTYDKLGLIERMAEQNNRD